MLGRDKITVKFCPRNGPAVTVVYYGVVVTEHNAGKLGPFGGVTQTRLILPRHFDPPDAAVCNMSFAFGDRTNARLETSIVPIRDGRGRIRHYEGVIRSG